MRTQKHVYKITLSYNRTFKPLKLVRKQARWSTRQPKCLHGIKVYFSRTGKETREPCNSEILKREEKKQGADWMFNI